MIKQNYSTIKPSINLDFINTDKLDSRVNFQRNSPGAYHDGTHTVVGSNLICHSQDLDGADWRQSNVTIMTDVSAAPDGTQTADKIIINSDVTSGNTFVSPEQDGSRARLIDDNQTYTLSFYIKSAGYNYLRFQVYDQSLTENETARKHRGGSWIDLSKSELYTPGKDAHKYDNSNADIKLHKLHNGWHRVSVKFTRTRNSGNVDYWFYPSVDGYNTDISGDGESGVLLWGVQVEHGEHATDYIKTEHSPAYRSCSLLKFASNDQPRFDHDPITGEPRGLLIEEQRYNLMPSTEGVSQKGDPVGDSDPYARIWPSRSYCRRNNTTAPDGTHTATTVYYDGTPSTPYYYVHELTSLTTNKTYTFSVYVKLPHDTDKNAIWGVQLHLHSNISNDNTYTYFNLIEGKIEPNITTMDNGVIRYANRDGTIEPVGNGWYRLSITGTTRADDDATYTDTSWNFGIYPLYDLSTGSFLIGGDEHEQQANMPMWHIWGVQVEEGDWPTSLIKTKSTQWSLSQASTREADLVTISEEDFNSWYNTDQGTIFCDAHILPTTGNSGRPVYNFMYTDNSPSDALAFSRDGTATYHYFKHGDISEYKHYMDTSTDHYKACLSYSHNDIISFVNGVENFKLRDGTPRDNAEMFKPDQVTLGGISTSTGNFLRGWIKQFTYYPQRLTDEQTHILTS